MPVRLGPVALYHLFSIVNFYAAAFQYRAQLRQMLVIAGFDRAKNVYRRDVRAGECAIMNDLLSARSGRSDLRSQVGQATGSVANHCSESAKPAICDQAALNYTTENVRIN